MKPMNSSDSQHIAYPSVFLVVMMVAAIPPLIKIFISICLVVYRLAEDPLVE